MTQSRILYLDLLRFLATLAVILLHVSCTAIDISTNPVSYSIGLAYDSICRWCVPVFVMISGSLFLNKEKQITITSLYKKYILRIIAALVFWVTIYIWVFEPLLHIIKHVPFAPSSFMDALRDPFSPGFHLWFLPMIIMLYIFLPFFKLVATDEKISNYFLILWFAWACLTSIFSEHINYLQFTTMVFGFGGYMILGHKFSTTEIRFNKIVLFTILVAVCLIVFIVALHVPNVEIVFQYLNPLVIIMSVTIFCLIKSVCKSIKNKLWLGKLLIFVQDGLFGVYLIHLFLIRLLFRPHFYGHMPVLISIPLFSIIVFIVSLFTIKVMRKIPIIRYICS